MKSSKLMIALTCLLTLTPTSGLAAAPHLLKLGSEQLIQAGGVDIDVPGYSVPSFVDWNADGLGDLVIGQGGGAHDAKVRIYLNTGSKSEPQFTDHFYLQRLGADASWPAGQYMGAFPHVAYWDEDDRKDMLVGLADGTVRVLENSGTDAEPVFTGQTFILTLWNSYHLDVGEQATPALLDWDNDGRTDMVSGSLDGKVNLYINCGCGHAVPPSFFTSQIAGTPLQQNGQNLIVPSHSSSTAVMDLDGDGNKDILTGNTDGQLLFYTNIGTDAEPAFDEYSLVTANGTAIDISPAQYSRPSVCDWNADGYLDILLGSSDGKVRLYQGVSITGDIDKDYNVDMTDYVLFAQYAEQGDCELCPLADVNRDGWIDFLDLAALSANWLQYTE